MIAWLLTGAWWIIVGIVVKTLVPMPWLDDPVRKAWGWLAAKVGLRR